MIIPQYHPSLYHSDIISWGAFCKVSFAVCSWTFKYAPPPGISLQPHHHQEWKEIWGYFSSNEIFHFHAVSLSTQIDSLLFGPDEWEHETSVGINNCLESSLLSLNVTFQKRAWGIGLVTRREGLYRSENKQLKTFCWLHVFLWMIITCLQRCSQHLLQWSYATPGLLYMILFAPYLPLQLTFLRKRFFSNNFLTFSSLYLLILSNNWRNCGLTVKISFEMGQGYPGTAYNGENFGQFDFDCALWSRFLVPSLSFNCKKVDIHKFDIITGSVPY